MKSSYTYKPWLGRPSTAVFKVEIMGDGDVVVGGIVRGQRFDLTTEPLTSVRCDPLLAPITSQQNSGQQQVETTTNTDNILD